MSQIPHPILGYRPVVQLHTKWNFSCHIPPDLLVFTHKKFHQRDIYPSTNCINTITIASPPSTISPSTMPVPKAYKASLFQFMSFLDGTTYSPTDDIAFTTERLASITADDVVRYFNFKAYRTPEPGPDDHPKYCRSSTLLYQKKAISYFMPRQNMQWDDLAQRGNPTKSSGVNKVIVEIKQHEVRGTGVPTSARRAVEWQEYIDVLTATRQVFSNRPATMVRLLALLTLQWHFVARLDDCMRLALTTVLFNYSATYTLYIKMVWSKNIRTERESPTQILLAAMNPLVCALLNLAVMMETVGVEGGMLFGRSHKTASNNLKQVYSSSLFSSTRPGKLGTHSMRKGPATFASRFGMPKDWINQRGRWRGKKQQVDQYIEVFQPYPDAKVAGVLCGTRGPCMYKVKDDMNVPSAFLESITPNSCAAFNPAVAKVLALPLLWASYERVTNCNGKSYSIIPEDLAASIQNKWLSAGGDANINPIEKVALEARHNGDQLILVPLVQQQLPMAADGGVAVESANTDIGGVDNNDRDVLLAQNQLLQQSVEELKNEMISILAEHRNYMVTMNSNLRRIAIQPVVRRSVPSSSPSREGTATTTATTTTTLKPAHLSRSPNSLYLLWDEYEIGLGDNKAAKDFTEKERGAVKYTYYRRKIFWETIERLMRRGHTSRVAIDMVRVAYGQGLSVTAVINLMKEERSKGRQRL